jgi:hypothetical protein
VRLLGAAGHAVHEYPRGEEGSCGGKCIGSFERGMEGGERKGVEGRIVQLS